MHCVFYPAEVVGATRAKYEKTSPKKPSTNVSFAHNGAVQLLSRYRKYTTETASD